MGLDYEVEVMAFPPRFTTPDFLNTNELGTIPYMIDGDVHMTESSGIPLYLGEIRQARVWSALGPPGVW